MVQNHVLHMSRVANCLHFCIQTKSYVLESNQLFSRLAIFSILSGVGNVQIGNSEKYMHAIIHDLLSEKIAFIKFVHQFLLQLNILPFEPEGTLKFIEKATHCSGSFQNFQLITQCVFFLKCIFQVRLKPHHQ